MLPLKDYIQHPATLLLSLLYNYGSFIPDKLYLQLLYRLRMGYWPDLKSPKTFNEKLQWLKLYDRQPEYTKMVDKYEVKKYVAEIIGSKYIIPTYGVWERPEDIDWDSLPKQFVLKTTHGSGSSGVLICKDKETFDKVGATAKLKKAMTMDVYRSLREWPYKNVHKRIIAEELIKGDNDTDLADYKLYCFDGVPRFFFICDNRFTATGMTVDCYTTEWEHVDVKVAGHDNPGGHKRPVALEEMLSLARRLSKGKPHVRCDFYYSNGKIYFSELTFFSSGGFGKTEPKSYDLEWGKMISLSNNNEVKD